jgi:hypothetical protein
MRSLYSDFEFRPDHVMLIDVGVHIAGYKVLCDGNGVSALPIGWLQRSNHKGAGATEGEG